MRSDGTTEGVGQCLVSTGYMGDIFLNVQLVADSSALAIVVAFYRGGEVIIVCSAYIVFEKTKRDCICIRPSSSRTKYDTRELNTGPRRWG